MGTSGFRGAGKVIAELKARTSSCSVFLDSAGLFWVSSSASSTWMVNAGCLLFVFQGGTVTWSSFIGRSLRGATRRVLGLCCGAGPRGFPAFSTASAARVRGCWVGAAFSGLMFSWSSWSAVCCNVSSAEPASPAEGPGAELPNITVPGGGRRDQPAAPSSVHSPPADRLRQLSRGIQP